MLAVWEESPEADDLKYSGLGSEGTQETSAALAQRFTTYFKSLCGNPAAQNLGSTLAWVCRMLS